MYEYINPTEYCQPTTKAKIKQPSGKISFNIFTDISVTRWTGKTNVGFVMVHLCNACFP